MNVITITESHHNHRHEQYTREHTNNSIQTTTIQCTNWPSGLEFPEETAIFHARIATRFRRDDGWASIESIGLSDRLTNVSLLRESRVVCVFLAVCVCVCVFPQ